jgi:hypothetical protein
MRSHTSEFALHPILFSPNPWVTYHRDDPHRNRTPKLECLKDSADNGLCPIKLILILALRTGNIAGADSIEKALELARARKSQTIVWAYPERPVICAIIPRGKGLLREKAANRTQVTKTLAEGGMVAGVIASLASHDLRFGAARDAANLSKKIKGIPSVDVATTLGHSMRSYDKGLTAQYVGAMSTDTWTSRVKEDFQDPFGPQIDETAPLPKRRRMSPDEITRLCEGKGLDASDKKARARAAYQDKQQRKKDWISSASKRSAGLVDETSSPQSALMEDEYEDEELLPAAAAPSMDDDAGDTVHEATNLESVITGSSDAVMTQTVEMAIFDQMVNAAPDTTSSYSQLDFIKKFSAINISCNQSLVRPERRTKEALANITGNSRDELSFFMFACKNAALGCEYRSASRNILSGHEMYCRLHLSDESV